jgi:hypothetical protein
LTDPRLISYIRDNLANGVDKEQLRQTLIDNGWHSFVVDDAMQSATEPDYSSNASKQNNTQQNNFSQNNPEQNASSKGTFTNSASPESSPINIKTRKTNPIYIYIIIAAAIILIAGGVILFLNAKKTPGIKECETDMACFIEASGLCTPANVTSYENTDFLGMNVKTTYYYEIQGLEQNRCLLFLKVDKISIDYANSDFIAAAQAEEDMNAQIGKSGICKYNITDLTATLIRWKSGIYDTGNVICANAGAETTCTSTGGDFSIAECTGTYFS